MLDWGALYNFLLRRFSLHKLRCTDIRCIVYRCTSWAIYTGVHYVVYHGTTIGAAALSAMLAAIFS